MKYAINSKGEKTHCKNASKGHRYLCPYCTEELNLRGRTRPCFAHKQIRNRTPLQRTCPEYNENNKISDKLDIIYIENGGVPLYLHNDGNRFELRAYFPNIKESSMKKLIENKTQVKINNKIWCMAENLNYYPVNNIDKEWIDVSVEPETLDNEVKRKWLWGIRGINIEKDIYHSNKEGGYRVSIKGNIYVSKRYRMLFIKENIPKIQGITFTIIGDIKLKKYCRECTFSVCDMEINEYTDAARQFIESKGYKLKQKDSELIPLWPPIIFKGKEIISDSYEVYFCHIDKSNNEKIYEVNSNRVYKIESNIFSIKNISLSSEKSVAIVEDKIVDVGEVTNTSTEIRYIISYKKKLNDRKLLEPKIIIQDIEGNIIDFNNRLPFKGKVFIKSNIPIYAMLRKNSYCIYSSENILEGIDYRKDIIIDCKAFGKIVYRYKKEIKESEDISWNSLYLNLYRCRGVFVSPKYNCKNILYKLRKNLNEYNIKTYLILYNWVQGGRIPIDAQHIIDKNERKILND